MKHLVTLDADHRYFVPDGTSETGSRQVPGYSEICAAMGVTKPNPYYTEAGRARGTAVHEWASFIAKGGNPMDPDGRIKDRVDAFKTFMKWSGFKLAGTEISLYEPTLNYACTEDLFGHIGPWAWVLDIKTGAKRKTDALQTAAQKIALAANGFRAQKRGCVYLKSKHKIDEHTDMNNEIHWRAIVAGYHAMTDEERKIFAADGFDLESFGREKSAKFRIIANAHAARRFYQ